LEGADVTSWKFHREPLSAHELALSQAEHTINTRVYLEYFSKDDTPPRRLSQYRQTTPPWEGEAGGYSVNNTRDDINRPPNKHPLGLSYRLNGTAHPSPRNFNAFSILSRIITMTGRSSCLANDADAREGFEFVSQFISQARIARSTYHRCIIFPGNYKRIAHPSPKHKNIKMSANSTAS
jgi:hypothetical protein